MTPETVEVAPPITAPGDKLEEIERVQLENHYLRVINAQHAYDLAIAQVEGRDRVRREMNNAFTAYRTTLEAKYKTGLGPGKIKEDGTIIRPVAAPVRPLLTPADFPTNEEAKAQLTPPSAVDTLPAPVEVSA